MKRRLLNLATLLSLLLCGAVAALWVRSHWVTDSLYWNRPEQRGGWHFYWTQSVSSAQGCLAVGRSADMFPLSIPPHPTPPWQWDGWVRKPAHPHAAPPWPLEARPRWVRFTSTPPVQWFVVVPYWVIALPLAALPALSAARRLRARLRRRRQPSLCPACGYDLRATPGTCPECGTAAATPAGSTT
jgi:hypothetical protein